MSVQQQITKAYNNKKINTYFLNLSYIFSCIYIICIYLKKNKTIEQKRVYDSKYVYG